MNIIQAIILGIIQGLTEFLPVSSSAHLVITPFLAGWQIPPKSAFIFDVLVQDGTLVAVIIYFWRDLTTIFSAFLKGIWKRQAFIDPMARQGWYLIIATIPAGIFGLAVKDKVEAAFNSPLATGCFLLLTAFLLLIAERLGKRLRAGESITWKDALVMGLFQTVSIFPGVSRSGATITGGMVRNLNRPAAARFSFLMSVPIMLAAGLLATFDLVRIPGLTDEFLFIITGFLAAAVVGYLSISWLMKFLSRRPLTYFAVYCLVIGLVVIAVFLFKSTSVPFTSASIPTQQPIKVALTPEMRPIQSILTVCGNLQPEIAVFTLEAPTATLLDLNADLVISFGTVEPMPSFATQIGVERIIIILNPKNTITRLTQNDLQDLYTGQITNWQHLGGPSLPVNLWTYASGNRLHQAFEDVILGTQLKNIRAFLAPDPGGMLEAVSKDPGAIGFIPKAWLEGSVRSIQLEDGLANRLAQPVIAMSRNEPQGAVGELLACLQLKASQYKE